MLSEVPIKDALLDNKIDICKGEALALFFEATHFQISTQRPKYTQGETNKIRISPNDCIWSEYKKQKT